MPQGPTPYVTSAPGNLARYFLSFEEAKSQPMGKIHLVENETGLVLNDAYDEHLIAYDAHYLTTNSCMTGEARTSGMAYIPKLIAEFFAPEDRRVLEIGCGQGELVQMLNSQGILCLGYDPTLRETSEDLVKEPFHPGISVPKFEPKLFIMRCVLPHISDPSEFLANLWAAYPNAAVLIEFQDFTHTLKTNAFWQITHDHVNYFTIPWFASQFSVIETSQEGEGEWSWALIRAPKLPLARIQQSSKDFLSNLDQSREETIEQLQGKRDLVIISAAGKGANLAFHLTHAGLNVRIIDLDTRKVGKFLECSGLEIESYEAIASTPPFQPMSLILPNAAYLEEVEALLPGRSIMILGSNQITSQN